MSASNTAEERAAEYHATIATGLMAKFVPDLLKRAAITPGDHVLDLACGTGIVAGAVARRMPGNVSVTGVDLNPAMLTMARQLAASEGLDATFDVGDVAQLPYADDMFDVVICQQALQFFPDRVAALREVRRVLKPGGRLVVAVMQDRGSNQEFDVFFAALEAASGTMIQNMPFSWGDPGALENTVREAGFETVQMDVITRNAELPGGDRWVERQISAASAGVPEIGALSLDRRKEIARQVERAMRPLEARLRDGDVMVMPATTNLATAW